MDARKGRAVQQLEEGGYSYKASIKAWIKPPYPVGCAISPGIYADLVKWSGPPIGWVSKWKKLPNKFHLRVA